jgi:hypothetical protein
LKRLVAALAVATCVVPGISHAASRPNPVPSLEPRATAQLWRQLVHRRHPTARADCTPQRLVFYAQTDWLRLATKLAANASPCAQYYISIPPLSANKTAFRTDQASRIRALGPQFHALAEVNVTGWSSWVTDNGGSWLAAGVEARRRMAAAGFDLAAGDSWAVNEASSAVRAGTGTARANLDALVKGLFAGDAGPQVKGTVFVTGLGQPTTPLATYKANLESWFLDAPFWSDMSAFVADWSQEVYGDVRAYAVPGATLATRKDELNAYLQHVPALATAGATSAASYLQSASSPLANAAWQYSSAYGWTAVPFDQMQDFVSAQVDALASASTHFGFAWALSQPAGMTATDFATQTGAIADRLAAAIHDAALAGPDAACAGTCTLALPGAAFNEGWKDLRTWSPPTLVFTNPPLVTAASAPAQLALQIQIAGITKAEPVPVQVTLSSTSPGGSFSPATLTIPPGTTDATVLYSDTVPGTPTITAAAAGHAGATQVVTVTPTAVTSLAIAPTSATLRVGQQQTFTATAADATGNPVAVTPTWSATGGTIAPTGASATFTATTPGTASVVVTFGSLSATANIVVLPARVRVASIRYRLVHGRVRITFALGTRVRAQIQFVAPRLAAATLTTNTRGVASFTTKRAVARGCYSTRIASVRAPGLSWDRKTPANRFCVR